MRLGGKEGIQVRFRRKVKIGINDRIVYLFSFVLPFQNDGLHNQKPRNADQSKQEKNSLERFLQKTQSIHFMMMTMPQTHCIVKTTGKTSTDNSKMILL